MLYTVVSAILAAAILGMAIFLLVRGFQWRAALADLRAEPGIEILSVERTGFFGKRLRGLRDPLAPPAETILAKHNIGPHSYDLLLTEYHSLNTPYAEQRTANAGADLVKVKADLVESMGEFARELAEKREADLEKITRMLLEAKFPAAMESVDIRRDGDGWKVEGELFAPERAVFVEGAPAFVVEGEVDFSGLVDLTAQKTSELRELIESPNLLDADLDGNLVHLDRMTRLVADYDAVCERSKLPPPALRLDVALADPTSEEARERIEGVRSGLTGPEGLSSERFLPDELQTVDKSTEAVRLVLVPSS